MEIGLAADHGGFKLKEALKSHLISKGYKIIDFGALKLNEEDDYPDFVIPLSRAVAKGEVARGIAVCGSGVGASIAANKIPGVRAAVVHEVFSAHQGVEDDNMNIMSIGGRVIGKELAFDLIDTFLHAKFTGEERHKRRLRKIQNLEEKK